MSDQSQPAEAPAPVLRLRASPKVRRKLHRCPTVCPFTEGAACEPEAPVAPAPRDLVPYLPGDVEYVCQGCVPKAEAALAELRAQRDRERREKAQARKAAKDAKREARAAAEREQADLAKTVADVEDARRRYEELQATAEERRRARADERRQALLELRRCEGAVRKANQALEDAKRALSAIPMPGQDVGVEIDREGLGATLLQALERTGEAWRATTKSHARKHMDRGLIKRAVDLAEWLDPESA